MKSYNYIYIDDALEDGEKGTINGIQGDGDIKITFKEPNEWKILIDDLRSNMQKYDGLILDLRLNDNPNKDGLYAPYRGSAVAQELRTLAKENVFKKDFPIILISGNNKIEESLDTTSIDLFDVILNKNTIEDSTGYTYDEIKQLLRVLSEGYNFLSNDKKSVKSILDTEEIDDLDRRFIDQLESILNKPNHIIAQFIIKKLLSRKTFLIDEKVLAARLGVDTASLDWDKLKHTLEPYMFTGLFSGFYKRWWMNKINVWWQKEISNEVPLRSSSGEQRVETLQKALNLKNLNPAQKTARSKSSNFWTVCIGSDKPIDTVDGLVIQGQNNLFPWQEKDYISIDEALRPSNKDVWKDVDSLEKNRLEKLKEIYGKTEQRIRR